MRKSGRKALLRILEFVVRRGRDRDFARDRFRTAPFEHKVYDA
jgi:hypothetical protein